MLDSSRSDRLSHITTLWTLVRQAHLERGSEAHAAQEALLKRYSGAIYRYLLGALRNPHEADELFQEFCLRFVRGDFRRANPERGRFRDFVKTSLFHLILDHRKKRKHASLEMSGNAPGLAVPQPETFDSDVQFLNSWREELLDRAWLALAQNQQETGQQFYSVLRLKAEQPQRTSGELAARLSADMGRPWSEDNVRQTLHRARLRFAELLLEEVIHSLENPSNEVLEQELVDLGLLTYCKSALQKRSRA